MKRLVILLINIYKTLISPVVVSIVGHGCRHETTCSTYTIQSIESNGLIKGVGRGFKRFAGCHPFSLEYTNEV